MRGKSQENRNDSVFFLTLLTARFIFLSGGDFVRNPVNITSSMITTLVPCDKLQSSVVKTGSINHALKHGNHSGSKVILMWLPTKTHAYKFTSTIFPHPIPAVILMSLVSGICNTIERDLTGHQPSRMTVEIGSVFMRKSHQHTFCIIYGGLKRTTSIVGFVETIKYI